VRQKLFRNQRHSGPGRQAILCRIGPQLPGDVPDPPMAGLDERAWSSMGLSPLSGGAVAL
jgi:hypothetical protein